MNQLDFRDRTAVITGGAAGIGLAIAQRLAASGAALALWDRDASALQAVSAALPRGAITHALDVADAASVVRAAETTAHALGRIDVLVCSAGITGPTVTTWEYPLDAWRQVMDVNVNGLFYCNRAVVPQMLKNNYGRIVNIASVAGKEGNPNASAYSASKAAVIGLTKSLGKELAKTGIRGQLRHAGGRAHGDLRPDVAAAHRLHALQDSDGALRHGRVRSRRFVCWLASEGLLVLDGRRVRRLRRTRDVLTFLLDGPQVGKPPGFTPQALAGLPTRYTDLPHRQHDLADVL
jgi:3-oxoacyl-[acyl-carrier protein] reductase